MSVVILLLSALGTTTSMVTTVGSPWGGLSWNVTKFSTVSPPPPRSTFSPDLGIIPKDVWNLLSSDLISFSSTSGRMTNESWNGSYAGIGRTPASKSTILRRTFPRNLISSNLNVMMRLQKLEYYFTTLQISEEDCRLRVLCEVAKDPAKFSPLAIAFLDETRLIKKKSA